MLQVGQQLLHQENSEPKGTITWVDERPWYKIDHVDAMRPFLMSIVSATDHWMFISSLGGLTAGRINKHQAIFPYITDDKLHEAHHHTGSYTAIKVGVTNHAKLWIPHSDQYRGVYQVSRSLLKCAYNNAVRFEEHNHDLQLKCSYQWSFSAKFGLIRYTTITNLSDQPLRLKILDGIRNVLPAGVDEALLVNRSNLVDAYKRTEYVVESGTWITALSAVISDRAEPNESLQATVAFSSLPSDTPTLLTDAALQTHVFCNKAVKGEAAICGERGAFMQSQDSCLAPGECMRWVVAVDTNIGHAQLSDLRTNRPQGSAFLKAVDDDVRAGYEALLRKIATCDGLQATGDEVMMYRHANNVLFNVMRGGLFEGGYQLAKKDLVDYLNAREKGAMAKYEDFIHQLNGTFSVHKLLQLAQAHPSSDLRRHCMEFLPLSFSRRHGDPSRPWNDFHMLTQAKLEAPAIIYYEGNWRDVFQNWEALSYSFPSFAMGMVFKFLNTSTIDGYNPYKIQGADFLWEKPDPNDPWSYFGYWGDHQLIYLLKLLKVVQKHEPDALRRLMNEDLFVFADVPYRIKSYEQILSDPKNSLIFDKELSEQLTARSLEEGVDGKLKRDENNQLVRANLIEKLLITALTKYYNMVPGAGIWMNTQRPEWNDANNALVGNGISAVTLVHLLQYLDFLQALISDLKHDQLQVSEQVHALLSALSEAVKGLPVTDSMSDTQRKSALDTFGQIGEQYRNAADKLSILQKVEIDASELIELLEPLIDLCRVGVRQNLRADGMMHSYHIMELKSESLSFTPLPLMLEGQVAGLGSTEFTDQERLQLCRGLFTSELYCADRNSFMLYPERTLTSFFGKNSIPTIELECAPTFLSLLRRGNRSVMELSESGTAHFRSHINNQSALLTALEQLAIDEPTLDLRAEQSGLLNLYESCFEHRFFTGRAGTFYGYEGIGSIYWHMVSKLLLAVQDATMASSEPTLKEWKSLYQRVKDGLGIHKSPQAYGAPPIDPYSHTPKHRGAQQPGMTGQVKEDILSRWGEFGIHISDAQFYIDPERFTANEWSDNATCLRIPSVSSGEWVEHTIPPNAMAITYCGVPLVFHSSDTNRIDIGHVTGKTTSVDALKLTNSWSAALFQRTGEIARLDIYLDRTPKDCTVMK